MKKLIWILLCPTAVVLAACTDSDTSDDEDADEEMICEPGETQPCHCVGGLFGVQECYADGLGWGACYCPDEPDTDSESDTESDTDSESDTNPDCWNGPCCNTDASAFWPSTYECDSWVDYLCSTNNCGGEAQITTSIRYCSGNSNLCNGEVVAVTTALDDCDAADEYCETDGETFAACIDCEHGCGEGACYQECNPLDPCCNTSGEFENSSTVCDSWSEFRCSSMDCGGDPETRDVNKYCIGNVSDCSGATIEGSWIPLSDCSVTNQFCQTNNDTYAYCQTCNHLCDSGACSNMCLDYLQWNGTVTVLDAGDLEALDGYTHIEGSLIIDGTDLVDLDALHCLKHVAIDLKIENNGSLVNLSGLSSLESVGNEFFLRYNDLLTDMSGLDSFATATDGFYIMGNDDLETLSGLGSLQYVGFYFNISSNENLQSLSGLSSLDEVDGTLYIWGNNSLTALYGLESLTTIGGELLISGHASLSTLAGLSTPPCFGCNLYINDNPVLPTCEAIALRDQFVADGWPNHSYIDGNDDLATCE